MTNNDDGVIILRPGQLVEFTVEMTPCDEFPDMNPLKEPPIPDLAAAGKNGKTKGTPSRQKKPVRRRKS